MRTISKEISKTCLEEFKKNEMYREFILWSEAEICLDLPVSFPDINLLLPAISICCRNTKGQKYNRTQMSWPGRLSQEVMSWPGHPNSNV